MLMFLRFAAQFAICAALLAIVGMAGLFAMTPPVESPPLVSSAGVPLDKEASAQLIDEIFQAVRDDDAAKVRQFLTDGHSPNVRSPRGDTLLIVAAYRDSGDVVAELLKTDGVDLDAQNRAGLTAVSGAAFKGHDETLKALISAGANVNSTSPTQQTAIMFAKMAGKTSTVKILEEAGARESSGSAPASPAAK
ncbi:ankyrin repeat domain-containing protein [Blastopirellula sp. JC732]|uniref:Ankyrin repeat domain-containing protein n=1 Tax=Blastopirellula sediminis TaxID=2894196 RepID=A0A9X1MLC1_9BACT|nr:ankyrin repeat domain-containing protein [Blastopirellula sediminis]MCC9609211.1 ankyrin repeat domain-containing protein [Blastopirellula sediminis]MCC9628012.1 ankyrin repeat domain-containing protein [Blastopirellula sediminis]